MTVSAITIDKKDNVAVVLAAAAKGDWIACKVEGLAAAGPVPAYHKVALYDIPKGRPVVKYGECIGTATTDIRAGEHVHVHNVLSESLAAKGEGEGA